MRWRLYGFLLCDRAGLDGFVAIAGLGFPGAIFVAFAALNDCSYAGKSEADRGGEDDASETEVAAGDATAIDVTAETVGEPIAVAPALVHSKVLCPIEVFGRDPYQSMGVIGGQRTGKTYTAALHTQNVKRKLQARIIYINRLTEFFKSQSLFEPQRA